MPQRVGATCACSARTRPGTPRYKNRRDQMDLAASAVGRDVLVRQPDVRRQSSGLPEHVDRNSAAGGPVAADAEVGWLESRRYAFADDECAFLVEVAVVSEGCEIKSETWTQ
jgi:hypothetical protein